MPNAKRSTGKNERRLVGFFAAIFATVTLCSARVANAQFLGPPLEVYASRPPAPIVINDSSRETIITLGAAVITQDADDAYLGVLVEKAGISERDLKTVVAALVAAGIKPKNIRARLRMPSAEYMTASFATVPHKLYGEILVHYGRAEIFKADADKNSTFLSISKTMQSQVYVGAVGPFYVARNCTQSIRTAGEKAVQNARGAANAIASAQGLRLGKVLGLEFASKLREGWFARTQSCGTQMPDVPPPGIGVGGSSSSIRISRTLAVVSEASGAAQLYPENVLKGDAGEEREPFETPSAMPALDIRFPALAVTASLIQTGLPAGAQPISGTIMLADARAQHLASQVQAVILRRAVIVDPSYHRAEPEPPRFFNQGLPAFTPALTVIYAIQ